MNEELAQNLSKLLKTFNNRRIVTEQEMQQLVAMIVNVLSENKKRIDFLSEETQAQLNEALAYYQKEHSAILAYIDNELQRSRDNIELATKEQNNRAFSRLQELIAKIRLPQDGKDGKDGKDGIGGSPDTATEIRDKLESLKDEDRLDASAIKNLPKFVKEKAKAVLQAGARLFESLGDVSITITNKRQDLIAQYNVATNRWEDGRAITVGPTAPSNPKEYDIWIDTNI